MQMLRPLGQLAGSRGVKAEWVGRAGEAGGRSLVQFPRSFVKVYSGGAQPLPPPQSQRPRSPKPGRPHWPGRQLSFFSWFYCEVCGWGERELSGRGGGGEAVVSGLGA